MKEENEDIEMKRTLKPYEIQELKNNRPLEQLFAAFYDSESDEDLDRCVDGLLGRALEGGELLTALDIPNEVLRKKAQEAGSFRDLDIVGEEVELSFSVVETEDGETWVVAFTGEDQLSEQEDDEDFYLLPIADLLLNVQQLDDAEGIILNPWTTPFAVQKDMIQFLLERFDEDQEEGNITLIQGDITELEVDAIVNAANNTLLGGGGVDGAIHRAAGKGLLEECRTLRGCKTGEAKITYGYDLPAKYVIHTVGPIYSGKYSDKKLLQDCYWNSLTVARDHGIHTIAFPSISTGVYGYPVEKAVDAAVPTVLQWLGENDDYDMRVTFCCFDDQTFQVYKKYLDAIME